MNVMALDDRQMSCLTRWLFRMAQYKRGRTFPDGRDAELRAKGFELEWRVRVVRNEQRRARKRYEQRVAQARQEAIKRWSGNVVHISEARR